MESNGITNNDKLTNGWTRDCEFGLLYHFEYLPLEEAKELENCVFDSETFFVVDTINWNIIDDQVVRLNKYFALTAADALAFAQSIVSWSEKTGEDVIAIRAASHDEIQDYAAFSRYYNRKFKEIVLSDEDVEELRRCSENKGRKK